MRIWKMAPNNEATQVTPSEKWSLDLQQTFDGRPLASIWTATELIRPRGYRTKKLTEIVQLAPTSQYVLSEKAVAALSHLLEGDTELLPVSVEGRHYWIMYVTTVLDCVVYDKSEYRLLSNGRIYNFDALWLDGEKIIGHNIFKLKDHPLRSPYVSDALRLACTALDPDGPEFILAWDSESNEPIRSDPLR